MQANTITLPDKNTLTLTKDDDPQRAALSTIWAAVDQGIDVFHAAAAGLIASTHCDWITICSLNNDKKSVEVKALWEKNHFTDCCNYDLKGTPCDLVAKSENSVLFRNVTSHFPEDKYLIDLGVTDYVGLSFKNKLGQIIGHISLMDSKPFDNPKILEKILHVVCSAVSLDLRD